MGLVEGAMRLGWLAIAAGCVPTRIEMWIGTQPVLDPLGEPMYNEMEIKDGTARVTLYSMEPSTFSDGALWFDWQELLGTVEADEEGAVFSLACPTIGCGQYVMVCAGDELELQCDMIPDYYSDDLAMLRWEPDPRPFYKPKGL